MAKYAVFIKYGQPGKPKSSGQTVYVEAESESTAMKLAVTKFKNSNASYAKVDAVAERVTKQ